MPQDNQLPCGAQPVAAEQRIALRRLFESEDFKKGVGTGLVTVRVFVHIVARFKSEHVSITEIQSQIDVLNQDFQASNVGARADAQIAFQWDEGNTAFISATKSTPAFSEASVRAASPFRAGFLNVWVCALAGDKGVATYPWDHTVDPGVVILRRAFGTTGTLGGSYRGGRTATHEVGHWLGLLHVVDDTLADTEPIMPDDFMSGTAVDADMELFTADQVAVMRGFLSSARSDTIV